LRVVGIVVALIAVSIGTLMLVLQTRWGGERLRRQLVAQVNRQIQGELSIGRLSFGGHRLVAWDIGLRDPNGHRVAQVARAEIDFRVMRLLREELRLTAVVVDSPRLFVDSDPAGTDLSRALAPRKKTKPPPRRKTVEEGWVIRLDRFDLRDGALLLASTNGNQRKEVIHLEGLESFVSLRYATGNGSTDLAFRMSGRSVDALVGPLAMNAEARIRGDRSHLNLDGHLLGGTVQLREDVDTQHLEAADVLVAIAIPRTELEGYGWGPLSVDGRAHPGTIPRLDLSLAIPGLEVTAKGGGTREAFKLESRLALDDLTRTGKAAQALITSPVPSMAGQGDLRVTLEGPPTGAPGDWKAASKGFFRQLRYGENSLADLSIEGHAAQLGKIPGELDLAVTAGSVLAGTTKLAKVELGAKVRQRSLSASASLASPEPLNLAVEGEIDGDRQGLELSHVSLSYPQVDWRSDRTAHLRFEGQKVSLAGLRLSARDQQLAIDGSKDDDRVDARVALKGLRLDLLPTLLAPRDLDLGGSVDLDVQAAGELDNPRVAVRMGLEQGRFQTLSGIAATLDATLADQQIDGNLKLHAPFADMAGTFLLPVDPLAGGPVTLRFDVDRLNLAGALRSSGTEPKLSGRLTAQLRVNGSAGDPKVLLTVDGRDLNVERPAQAAEGTSPVDIGHASIRLTYEDRAGHADVHFASAHGGELQVDATARVDLSYPAVTEGIAAKKIPVHGKVVAKDFDVAWLARFNEQIETLGGRVSANAKIAGTVGDPQFIGDVRWKNGKVVTVTPTKSPERR
jgi:autotransporter translocation and assembly factor TamB